MKAANLHLYSFLLLISIIAAFSAWRLICILSMDFWLSLLFISCIYYTITKKRADDRRIRRIPIASNFVSEVQKIVFDWSIKHISEIKEGREKDAWDWFYSQMPSYDTLLESNKPFTLEAWFDKELVEKIKN